MNLDFNTYNKKVRGCFVGKSVGGTLGMKYEGNLNYNEVTYYNPVPTKMIPNDDLPLLFGKHLEISCCRPRSR